LFRKEERQGVPTVPPVNEATPKPPVVPPEPKQTPPPIKTHWDAKIAALEIEAVEVKENLKARYFKEIRYWENECRESTEQLETWKLRLKNNFFTEESCLRNIEQCQKRITTQTDYIEKLTQAQKELKQDLVLINIENFQHAIGYFAESDSHAELIKQLSILVNKAKTYLKSKNNGLA